MDQAKKKHLYGALDFLLNVECFLLTQTIRKSQRSTRGESIQPHMNLKCCTLICKLRLEIFAAEI